MRWFDSRFLIVFLIGMLGFGVVAAAEYYNKHDKSDDRRGTPEEGHALVYVFRPATMGAAIKTWAFADDQLLMVPKPKAYSFGQVPAGKRLFWTKSAWHHRRSSHLRREMAWIWRVS